MSRLRLRRPRTTLGELRPRRNERSLLFCLALPLAVGLLASLLTRQGMLAYAEMEKPLLAPPGWVFPVVWTALYLLMGLASWRVARSPAPEEGKGTALGLYAVSLAANFLWPLLFFGLGRYWMAFAALLALLILVLLTWDRFRRLDRGAGVLLLPYLLWLCFAAYLNLGAAILN